MTVDVRAFRVANRVLRREQEQITVISVWPLRGREKQRVLRWMIGPSPHLEQLAFFCLAHIERSIRLRFAESIICLFCATNASKCILALTVLCMREGHCVLLQLLLALNISPVDTNECLADTEYPLTTHTITDG